MTNTMTFKKIALAAALSLGAISTASTGANAMVLHNCTDAQFHVKLQDKNGNINRTTNVGPYDTASVHATKGFGPYRIILPALGPGGYFSNRPGDGTYSFVHVNGGNIGLKNGNACQQQPKPQPVSGGGNTGGGNAEVCFKNNFGLEICLRP